jgi:diguanylate cyclase (GGDEF)-like protein
MPGPRIPPTDRCLDAPLQPPGATAAGQPRVLVIDPAAAHHDAMQRLLGADCELAFVRQGAQGLAMAQTWAPQLILMELLLHDRDGFEVLAALRQNPQTAAIAVVFVTAQGGDRIESHCLEAGAADFVPKAAHPAVLKARVLAHLSRLREARDWRTNALRDALTGLANRTQFDERLNLEWGRAQRNGSPLTLVVADVDAFAVYNRRYGRAAGDEGLRRLAQLLREGVRRPTDLVARLDDDDFACLLPDVSLPDGLRMAHRWLQSLKEQALAHHFSPVAPVWTASFGVATHSVSAPTSNAQGLLSGALAALQNARLAGGARVHPDGPTASPAATTEDL